MKYSELKKKSKLKKERESRMANVNSQRQVENLPKVAKRMIRNATPEQD